MGTTGQEARPQPWPIPASTVSLKALEPLLPETGVALTAFCPGGLDGRGATQ